MYISIYFVSVQRWNEMVCIKKELTYYIEKFAAIMFDSVWFGLVRLE